MNQPAHDRVQSIDFLKGLVMVLMALDHTRDYFYQSSVFFDVSNPAHATLPVYLTRLVTHLCAPTFSFLAGVSAYMSGRRKSKADLSIFLIKRGLWLIFMELTIISFAWYFNPQFNNVDLAVIWVLGVSMIFLAAIIHLPLSAILIISVGLIIGHHLLDNIHVKQLWWGILHEVYTTKISSATLTVVYPIIPWVGVMSLGYYFGQFYNPSFQQNKRTRLFNLFGLASLLLFGIVRLSNLYGDPVPWTSMQTPVRTLMSFFNVNKYPPSLLYLLLTLSVALIILANSEKWRGRIIDFISVFGRVPFFYYVVHLYTIRICAMLAAELTGHGWQLMVQKQFDVDLKDFGFSLPIVYLIWALIILMLYPVCRWFDRYKQGHKHQWWTGYL